MNLDGNFWLSAILALGGGGGIITTLYTLVTGWRDRAAAKRKDEADTELTAGQLVEVRAEASKVNTEERIETERWWKEQFDAVKDELLVERKWRRRVTKYIKAHQPWDELAQVRLREAAIHLPPPPTLEINGDDDE